MSSCWRTAFPFSLGNVVLCGTGEAGKPEDGSGVQGETGVIVGWVCSSSSRGDAESMFAPGSRKEKKLCDRECLWWWPRREVDDEEVELADIRGAVGGERPPNVKPAPSGVAGCAVAEWERLTLEPAEGMGSAGASSSTLTSISCEPSSAMVLCGSEPGRGKNMDRFRE